MDRISHGAPHRAWIAAALGCAALLGAASGGSTATAGDPHANASPGELVRRGPLSLHPADPRVSLYRAALAMGHGERFISTLSPVIAREAIETIEAAGTSLAWIPDDDGLPALVPREVPDAMWPLPAAEALAARGMFLDEATFGGAGADLFEGEYGNRRFADGDRNEEGASARGTIGADLTLTTWAYVAATARLETGRTVTRVRWPRAALVAHAGGVRVTLGRESRWWGAGVLNDVMLTTNAFPTDAIEVATDGTRTLPLGLGSYRASVLLGYLDDADRPTRYPLLFGHRIAWRPASWLELGAERTIMLGGAGRTERYTPRILWDIFLGRGENDVSYVGFRDTDQKVGFDGVLHLSRALAFVPYLSGARFFFRYAGDDSFEGILPTRVAHHYGSTFIFPRVRVEVELFQNTTAGIWYWNNEYPAGYVYRGDFLATDLGWDARSGRARVSIALARDLGARIELFVDSRGKVFHQGDGVRPVRGPDESRAVESALALTHRLGPRSRVTIEYRRRDVDGFTFDDDRTRARHLLRATLRLLGG